MIEGGEAAGARLRGSRLQWSGAGSPRVCGPTSIIAPSLPGALLCSNTSLPRRVVDLDVRQVEPAARQVLRDDRAIPIDDLDPANRDIRIRARDLDEHRLERLHGSHHAAQKSKIVILPGTGTSVDALAALASDVRERSAPVVSIGGSLSCSYS